MYNCVYDGNDDDDDDAEDDDDDDDTKEILFAWPEPGEGELLIGISALFSTSSHCNALFQNFFIF